METSKIALGISGSGLLLALSAWIRYFIIFYDPSQAFDFIILGGLIFVFGYLYNWIRQEEKRDAKMYLELKDDINKINSRLDSLASFFMGEEKETIKAQAKGEA